MISLTIFNRMKAMSKTEGDRARGAKRGGNGSCSHEGTIGEEEGGGAQ